MEVRNLFRKTHYFGEWKRLDGELYEDDQGRYWGPLVAANPKHQSMIESYSLLPTGGIAYSYRTIRNGQPRWFAVEVRIVEGKAYFSDYDAWMEIKRGKTNPFVESLVDLSRSLGNIFGYKA